jgi:hypothetical protein
MRRALYRAWPRTGQLTLRISVDQNTASIGITLEGRVAGPWVAELGRTWADLAPSVGARKVSLDLCNTTYADDAGIRVLRAIYGSTAARIVTSSPWTQYLAEEITRTTNIPPAEEASR